MNSRKSGNAGGVGKTTLLLVYCLLLCIAPRAIGQVVHELVTTYEGGWIQDGVMFDVKTVRTPIDLSAAVGTTTSIGYKLDVPPQQKSGAYSGSVTYQVTTTP